MDAGRQNFQACGGYYKQGDWRACGKMAVRRMSYVFDMLPDSVTDYDGLG
jgi:hypothetical protein